MDMPRDNRILWLWFSLICGPASSSAERLLDHFGSVEAVYEADAEAYQAIPKLRSSLVERLCNKELTEAGEVNAYCRNEGVGILTPDSPLYSARLARIQRRPMVLYYKGLLTDLEREVCIAAVGTRTMTEYGSRSAYSMAYDLAKAGAVVVSGMAKGVDGMAHRGALDGGGYTVAVLGCGIDRVYPAAHADLMRQILKNGLVITEYKPFTEPKGSNFPLRNRIISGLSQGTVVIEAPRGSGALITAQTALGQGRDVFALPGKVGEMSSIGTNELIRDGARIVTCAADILLEYQPLYGGKINLNNIPSVRSVKFSSPIHRAAAPVPFTVNDVKREEAAQEAVARAETDMKKRAEADVKKCAEADRQNRAEDETVSPVEAMPQATPQRTDTTPPKAPKKKPSLFGGIEKKTAPASKAAQASPVAVHVQRDFSAYPDSQRRILTLLNEQGTLNSDQLAQKAGLPVGDVLAELTMLEIGGEITALPGGFYELTSQS
jgi:DNA processing protein